jgi:hypothetical protein
MATVITACRQTVIGIFYVFVLQFIHGALIQCIRKGLCLLWVAPD